MERMKVASALLRERWKSNKFAGKNKIRMAFGMLGIMTLEDN